MLELFYRSSWHLRRLRQAPFAESIDTLVGKFHRVGYSRRYSQRILWIVGKFNDHARAVGIETAQGVNDSLMQRFAEKLTHQRAFAPIALHHSAKHLRDQGIVPMVAAPDLNDPCEPILRNYGQYLCDVRGLALTSRTARETGRGRQGCGMVRPKQVQSVEEVSVHERPFHTAKGDWNILLVCLACNNNIIRNLVRRDLNVVKLRWNYD